jgi:ferredoxin-NADP reductase
VGPPYGDFSLPAKPSHARPIVLVSAGVGITPLLAMLETLVAQHTDRYVRFLYAAPSHFVVCMGHQVIWLYGAPSHIVSAGVGITPLLAMLETLVAQRSDRYIYAQALYAALSRLPLVLHGFVCGTQWLPSRIRNS